MFDYFLAAFGACIGIMLALVIGYIAAALWASTLNIKDFVEPMDPPKDDSDDNWPYPPPPDGQNGRK